METKAPDGIEFRDDIVDKFVGRDMHETMVDVKEGPQRRAHIQLLGGDRTVEVS